VPRIVQVEVAQRVEAMSLLAFARGDALSYSHTFAAIAEHATAKASHLEATNREFKASIGQ